MSTDKEARFDRLDQMLAEDRIIHKAWMCDGGMPASCVADPTGAATDHPENVFTTHDRPRTNRQIFNEVIATDEELNLVKFGSGIEGVQFHRVTGDTPDPFVGLSDLHDRLTAAFNEVATLEAETRGKVTSIFEKHGFGGHGFAASVEVVYVSELDEHRKGR